MNYRPNDILTVQQAAEEKQVNVSSVRRAIIRGDLKAQQTTKVYLIRYRDLIAWEPERRGRKPQSRAGKG